MQNWNANSGMRCESIKDTARSRSGMNAKYTPTKSLASVQHPPEHFILLLKAASASGSSIETNFAHVSCLWDELLKEGYL